MLITLIVNLSQSFSQYIDKYNERIDASLLRLLTQDPLSFLEVKEKKGQFDFGGIANGMLGAAKAAKGAGLDKTMVIIPLYTYINIFKLIKV